MAQRLKPEVRDRIIASAETVFARDGFLSAKMAEIAAVAGLSAGNVYRYFPGKDALFGAVIDPGFVARFDDLLDQRVHSLSGTQALAGPHSATANRAASTDDDAAEAADAMLRFWIAHRLRVVVLLDRCEGSPFADFGQRFVDRLVAMAVAHIQALRGGKTIPELVPFTLTTVFHTSRRAVVSILETYTTEPEIRAAFEAFWSFQVAGLAGLTTWAVQ